MVKLGIIGLGNLGTTHAKNIVFNIPGAALIAACGRESTLQRFSKKIPVSYQYTDYNDMLKNKEIDGILIITSVNSHAELTIKALEAGFHVFVEKPISLTLDEALLIESTAKKRPELICMTGYMRRYDASYIDTKKKIEAGDIGQAIMFRGYSLDKDAGAESAPERGDKNGVWFTEMIVHDIDLALWYLGSEVESVTTIGGCYKHKAFEKYNDIDNACTMMRFQNNAMAIFYTGRTAPHGSHVETEIVGTEGILRINGQPRRGVVDIYNTGGILIECQENYLERFSTAFIAEIQEFIDCISENRKPVISVYDSRKVTEISLAAYESYISNKRIIL